MSDTIVVVSRTPTGGRVEITLEKSGTDKGAIATSTWKVANPKAKDIAKMESATLSNIRTSANGMRVKADGRSGVFGGKVVCTIADGGGDEDQFVIVEISGTPLGIGSGKTVHPLSQDDCDKLLAFIKTAAFPLG